MTHSAVLAQKIYKQIQDLPEENLTELAKFVEFLRFKATPTTTRRGTKATRPRPLKVVKLGGILRGHDFPPELLAEARREMWKKYMDEKP